MQGKLYREILAAGFARQVIPLLPSWRQTKFGASRVHHVTLSGGPLACSSAAKSSGGTGRLIR